VPALCARRQCPGPQIRRRGEIVIPKNAGEMKLSFRSREAGEESAFHSHAENKSGFLRPRAARDSQNALEGYNYLQIILTRDSREETSPVRGRAVCRGHIRIR